MIMSTGLPRMVIVDDIDSRIQYNGPWFPDKGSQNSVGDNGPPFRSTLHGTQANASLVFTYHGSGVSVYGSTNISRNSGMIDPTWECYLDGILIGPSSLSGDLGNNWIFCIQDMVPDGPHILTVNTTVMRNQTFWFDDIFYVPSASAPLDQEIILVEGTDPQLQYGKGWQNLGTNTTGSIFTFDFIGVSISWYGITVPGDQPLATYSIDGQTPIDFVPNGTATYIEKFFETAQFPAGPHTLKVVYQGNNSTPLYLNYLVVQNGTLPSTATSVSSHATSTTTGNGVSGTSTPEKSSTPVGAIVGGVIGGLALIVFTILGFLLLRRHKRRAAEEKVLSSTPRPFNFGYTTLDPSSTTPTYPLPLQQSTLTIRKPSLTPPPVSRPSPLPLLSRAERKGEALTASESQRQGNTLPAMVSMQSNDIRSPNVVAQASGIRMPASTPATSIIMEAPPLYTVE